VSTIAQLLQHALVRLTLAGVDNPALDARLLLEAASGLTRTDMVLKAQDELGLEAEFLFAHFIERRCAREPVARVLGQREFWGLPFTLAPATLEPRPDSEVLIEAALLHCPHPQRILDLGTGTGCLLAALLHEWPQATGVAVDASTQALAAAQKNFAALGIAERVTAVRGDWWENVTGQFDLIISNPPYLTAQEVDEAQPEVRKFDPVLALDGGADGLDAYRTIVAGLGPFLKPQGVVVLELGRGQGTAVSALATAKGLIVKEIKPDLGAIPRALVLVNP
jgi:release factor glutamine methyltransferase